MAATSQPAAAAYTSVVLRSTIRFNSLPKPAERRTRTQRNGGLTGFMRQSSLFIHSRYVCVGRVDSRERVAEIRIWIHRPMTVGRLPKRMLLKYAKIVTYAISYLISVRRRTAVSLCRHFTSRRIRLPFDF